MAEEIVWQGRFITTKVDGKPMFLVTGPALVREACLAGVVGGLPRQNARSLDEFEAPDFVGRMARVDRRQKLLWWAMLTGAAATGVVIGLFLI